MYLSGVTNVSNLLDTVNKILQFLWKLQVLTSDTVMYHET